jgi:2-polyprenyl-3-methyl-5-hydroxy-6-metoxy-1,4-benzoquinol methylase
MARLRTAQIRAHDFAALLKHPSSNFAWQSENFELIALQGELSSAPMVDMFDEKIRPLLGELGRNLDDTPCSFLDVGAGVGSLSFAMAQRWPSLRVVGIEPASTPYRVALSRLEDNVLASRVEFINHSVEDMEFQNFFDLIWFPHVFISPNKVDQGLTNVAKSLKRGGWIWILHQSEDVTTTSEAIRCIQTFSYGGAPVSTRELSEALTARGFTEIHIPENRRDGQFRFLIARLGY